MGQKKLKLPANKSRVAIVYRSRTPAAVSLAKELTRYLKRQSAFVYTAPEQDELSFAPMASSQELKKCHLILALGGDGTYLRAQRLLNGAQVPILGIHLGSLGFLTTTKSFDALSVLKKAFAGQLDLLPRSTMSVTFFRKNKQLFKTLCLNDVVVERGEQSQLIHLSLSCGKDWITHAKADGIVVSTPLGSTAYNLAVGGPLLHPESATFAVSLIAPHALTVRPLVLPDRSKISISIAENGLSSICGRLVVDGRILTSVECQDHVVITRSTRAHWLVRDPQLSDFALLREKLKFGERT